MSQVEYVIDDYSIVVSEDATHVFHNGEWVGSRDKRHQALNWIYTLRRAQSRDARLEQLRQT
jgi:hypothetical protein